MLPMRSVPSVGPWRVFALSIAAVAVLTTAWLTARAAPLDEEWPDEADRLVKRLAMPRQATVAEMQATAAQIRTLLPIEGGVSAQAADKLRELLK